MNKIKYECGKCGWTASVPAQWGDIKPSYCGNQKCEYSKSKAPKTKKSFRTDPSALVTKKPEPPKPAAPEAKADSQPSEKKHTKRRKPKVKQEDGQSGSSNEE